MSVSRLLGADLYGNLADMLAALVRCTAEELPRECPFLLHSRPICMLDRSAALTCTCAGVHLRRPCVPTFRYCVCLAHAGIKQRRVFALLSTGMTPAGLRSDAASCRTAGELDVLYVGTCSACN